MNVNGIGRRNPIDSNALPGQRPAVPPAPKDRVDISDEGRLAQDVSELARKVLEMPEARPEIVAEAKRLVESGEIFTEQMARQTARAMLGRSRS